MLNKSLYGKLMIVSIHRSICRDIVYFFFYFEDENVKIKHKN